jgi:multidrug efflux system membrane fusion protein
MLFLALQASQLQAVELDASLQWSRRVDLSTPVSGVVVEVLAQPGQRVDKDQVLLRLDTKVRSAEVAQAKAQVARRMRLRDEAQRELDRAQELYNATLLSEHEMELARIGLDDAEAEYRKAVAVQAQAESDLKYSEVRAPFAAVVVHSNAEVGQTVATQLQVVPLLAVAESGSMVARANVTAAQARGLKPDQAIVVRAAGREYAGRVTRIGLEPAGGKGDERLYPLEVTFSSGSTTLRAGEPARIELP